MGGGMRIRTEDPEEEKARLVGRLPASSGSGNLESWVGAFGL